MYPPINDNHIIVSNHVQIETSLLINEKTPYTKTGRLITTYRIGWSFLAESGSNVSAIIFHISCSFSLENHINTAVPMKIAQFTAG